MLARKLRLPADPYTGGGYADPIGEYMDGIPGRKESDLDGGNLSPVHFSSGGEFPVRGQTSKAEINALAQAQIAVFPADVSGVDPNPAVSTFVASRAAEEQIASATGGRAFYNDNGVVDILNTATEDGGNYYTLTYAPRRTSMTGSVTTSQR